MAHPRPFVQQIDHLGIHTPRPRKLFDFFHETLGLPIAFPYMDYPSYSSGSVALGNCFLEIMRFGAPPAEGVAQEPAQYLILGFLISSDSLAQTREMLRQRDVAHSGIVPFFAPEASDDDPRQIWANVYLGGLLGANLWTRLFLWLTRYADPRPSDMESKALRAMSMGLMKRAFPRGMPVLTAYYDHLDEHHRAISPEMLRAQVGGLAGVQSVLEVVVGVRDLPAWRRFLATLEPGADDCYEIGPGPALHLVHAESPAIQALRLRVTSLDDAHRALRDRQQAVQREADHLTLFLPDSGGLALELVE